MTGNTAGSVRRPPSANEERLNVLVHAFGLLLAVLAAGSLWRPPMAAVAPALRFGMAVFCVAAALTMAASAVYHGLRPGPAKRWFLALDHAAIGMLIAGTYTPFTLLVLDGAARWALLLPLWSVALLSVAMQFVSLGTGRPPWIERHSYVLYLAMGWVPGLVVGRQVIANLPAASMTLLVAGGLAYTGGVALYLARRIPYHHALWHGAVVAGALLQFLAIRGAALATAAG